jgi:hypothetical protein
VPWRWRVGWLGLSVQYLVVALVLLGVHLATPSNEVQYGVLMALILLGPTAAAPGLARKEPAVVVVTAVAVIAATVVAIGAAVVAVSASLGKHGGPAFELWLALGPAIAAGIEAGRRVSRREAV